MKEKWDYVDDTIDLSVKVIYGQCIKCANFDDDNQTCLAYPKQIPEAIKRMKHDHTKPYDGDRGILFEEANPSK